MPESHPPIELQGISLDDLQKLAEDRKLPPVDRWNPDRCGHSGMRIARDGTWYHEGSPITRPAMVRLFSTVLRREPDGRHVLVTPVEKLDIDVDSTAFRAVEMNSEGEGRSRRIAFRLDSGDVVILGEDHPLRIVVGGAWPVAAHSRPARSRSGARSAGLLRAGGDRACGRPRPGGHLEQRHVLPA